MFQKTILFIICLFILISCSGKKEVEYIPSEKIDPYKVYQEGLDAFKQADFFTLIKDFQKQN